MKKHSILILALFFLTIIMLFPTQKTLAGPAIRPRPVVRTYDLYHITGNLTIGSDMTVNKPGVIFVDGDLYINSDLTNINPKTGIVFVVGGNIYIKRTVETVNAFLIAYNGFCDTWDATSCDDTTDFPTPASQKQLTINGSVIFLNATSTPGFFRQKSTAIIPAEIINYEPKYLAIMKNLFARDYKVWREVQ